jgi:hypothetical protein
MSAEANNPPSRPECMAILGLLPPYTLDDVKAAYRVKVMEAHPDRGGDVAQFLKIEDAYLQAIEYVNFRGDRRGWIAGQVEPYLRQQEVAAEVERRGGKAEYEQTDWLKRSFGDGFAMLADRLRIIRLRGTGADDAFLSYLGEEPKKTPYLVELDLAGSRITDQGLPGLAHFEVLKRLNLAGTAVTENGLRAVLETLSSLKWLNLADTGVGWLPRWRLRRAFPQVEIVTESDGG